jgi:diguanylate cyclase (GGDEF)-like protein
VDAIRSLFRLATSRSIRCRRDLWFFVARTNFYIVALAAIAAAIQSWHTDGETIAFNVLGVGAIACALTLPVLWEFGSMYLDLWKSTQALRDLAAKDQQTGLLNNRSFVGAVEERLTAHRSVALLVGDLDRFKTINDLHGHLAGDEVIAAVGETLRDMFDEIAVLGRMGGEEYAVMIECPFVDPEIAHAHGAALAEEMRRRIAGIVVATERGDVSPSISIGVAWSTPTSTFSELYARADKALYVAKSAGRDRVVGEYEIEFLDPERALSRRQDVAWRPVGDCASEGCCEPSAVRWA